MRAQKLKKTPRKPRLAERTSPQPGKVTSGASAKEFAPVEILHFSGGSRPLKKSDDVAREEPLEIRVRGQSVAVTMRTFSRDSELAAGFLLSEGIIHRQDDIIEIAPCGGSATPENVLNVFVDPTVEIDFARLTRHVFASSSCGLCGKSSIDEVQQQFPPVESRQRFSRAVLTGLADQLGAAQPTFARTGGLHAAAIFDREGKLLVAREDIGRHNAVDKVLGWGFLNGLLPFDKHVLLVSGRASFEIVQKALAAGVPVVAAVSAPSSLAVEFARSSNQTLIGFLRGNAMNVYTGAERIVQK